MQSTAYKNDLTQVNDLVTKLQLPIHFFDSQEPGFAGQRIFVVTLKVGTLCSVGKGHTKKEAKARAASTLLGPLKQMYLPPLQSDHQAKAKKRNTQQQVDKEEEERSQIDFIIEASPEPQSPQHHPWLDMAPTKPEVDKDDTLVSSPVEDSQDICTSPDVIIEEEWEDYLDSDTDSVLEDINNETGSDLCENPETRPEAEICEDTVVSEISSQPEELQEEHVIEADLEPESPQYHSLVDTTSTKPELDKDEGETGAEVASASPETSLMESRETDETKPEVDKEEKALSHLTSEMNTHETESVQKERNEIQEELIIEASPEPACPQKHHWRDISSPKPEEDKEEEEVPHLNLEISSDMNIHETESVQTKVDETQEELIIEVSPEPEFPQDQSLLDISSLKPEVDKDKRETGAEVASASPETSLMESRETDETKLEVDREEEERSQIDFIIEASPEPQSPQHHPWLDMAPTKPEVDKDERETRAEVVSVSPETSLMESRETDEMKPEVDKEEVCPLSEDVTAPASVDITEAGDVLTDQRRSLEMIEADVVSEEDFPCPPPILEGPSVASVLVRALVQKLVQKSYFKPEDQGENICLLLEKTEEHIHHQDVPISLKNMRAVGKAAAKDLLRECRLQGAPLRAEDEAFQKATVKHLNHRLKKFLFGPQRTGLSRLFAAVGRFFRGS
uniref:DRBM domain-containing protein n=1 Tax=Knipowitschia caucasica TaxID=637954 RepID=A0AAV2L0K8_KNICA